MKIRNKKSLLSHIITLLMVVALIYVGFLVLKYLLAIPLIYLFTAVTTSVFTINGIVFAIAKILICSFVESCLFMAFLLVLGLKS